MTYSEGLRILRVSNGFIVYRDGAGRGYEFSSVADTAVALDAPGVAALVRKWATEKPPAPPGERPKK